ncbi:MAG: cation:proton antiporter [Paludibacteraceae bacterium]|nr:cation:proton antiporter [Paludibacteraceae bacterium]
MVQDLYILMITAGVVSLLFKLLKQPVVLGYIVAGVLVGPYLFGETLVSAENVEAWGNIGVLFVLFCIGLEFRIKNLISSGKVAAIGALTIIGGMMLFGFGVGRSAELDVMNSLFLAGMLCMSSTTIVMKAIDEAGMSKERFVKGATSILIIEDIVAVVLMVLLSSIAIRHQFEGAELLGKVGDLAITLVLWFVFGILIIPTLLRKVKSYLNDETLIILSLGLCLGMVLTAEEAGFSSALGAFVMGMILAETVESHRIEKLMTPLKNVFAAIFFVSVGMMINPASLVDYWPSILLVCLVIIVGMILFGTLGCWWGGTTMRDAMLTSFSFVQIGEFSFIIAGLGNSLNVTDPVIYPIIVASSVVTTFLTPYIMKAAIPCYNFLYNHAPASLKAKIDLREQQVAQAEQQQQQAGAEGQPSLADKARHAVRHTYITKRLVNLFIKNMSAKDAQSEEKHE